MAIIGFLVMTHKSASNSTQVAVVSQNKLGQVAKSTLEQIRSLDQQAADVAHGEDPTLYLWPGGLRNREIPFDDAFKLASLLVERRRILGDTGPLLASSSALNDYLCSHYWFVSAESVPTPVAQSFYRDQVRRDPRFLTAETATGSKNPGSTGILIGFFVSHDTAMQLAKEIDLRPSSYTVNRAFLTNSYQPSCAADGTSDDSLSVK